MNTTSDESASSSDMARLRFEACFEAHHADVLAFAIRRIEGRAAAEDVASETFAVAWRKRDLVPDPSLPWLYAIARRVIANHRRSAKRRIRLRERLSSELGSGATSADPMEAVDERKAVLEAFSHLSEADREVLSLIAWEGLTSKSAARVLDCSPTAFRVRLYRARRKLRRQLDAGGHLAGAGSLTTPNTNRAEEAR